jgi:hypothetical protein
MHCTSLPAALIMLHRLKSTLAGVKGNTIFRILR